MASEMLQHSKRGGAGDGREMVGHMRQAAAAVTHARAGDRCSPRAVPQGGQVACSSQHAQASMLSQHP